MVSAFRPFTIRFCHQENRKQGLALRQPIGYRPLLVAGLFGLPLFEVPCAAIACLTASTVSDTRKPYMNMYVFSHAPTALRVDDRQLTG